jgi:cytochrome c2
MRPLVLAWTVLPMALAAAAFGALAQVEVKGDSANGAKLFEDRCAMCHVAAGGGQGPSLTGVFGRKAASAAGFHYSPALEASGITWTAPQLDRFLAGPGNAVPGTAMAIVISDPRQRADLIAFLESRGSRP